MKGRSQGKARGSRLCPEWSAVALLLLLGASVLWWTGAGAREANAQEATTAVAGRFPHDKHLDKVRNCTGCHNLDRRTWEQKRKVASNHSPCNTAVCHGEEWKKDPGDFCLTCHQKNLKVKYPPYRQGSESDWVVSGFSHKAHIGDKGDKACQSCHTPVRRVSKPRAGSSERPQADMEEAGHKACAKCHAKGQAPAMDDCQGCHKVNQAKGPEGSDWNNYRVSYAFWHQDHAKKSKQNECSSCHSNVMTGAGQAVPRPEMISCESCHNGEVAFNARGTECRRCHQIPEGLQ